jgi:16S rRNA (uracil1498-N3)-methyltransferase
MTPRRFYVPRDSIQDGVAYLPADQSHHLRDVLRISTGTTVEIFDGEGDGYIGEVVLDGSDVAVHHLRPLEARKTHIPLILAAALVKPAKFEWMLEKVTELGVQTIVPLNTHRSDIRVPPDRIGQRCERWNRIVREASKQCGRFSTPAVREPQEYASFLQGRDFPGFSKLLFYEKAPGLWRPETAGDLSGGAVLCIGPEGGWEDFEVESAARSGFGVFGLGHWTLRTETAAIAAVAIVQYHLHLQNHP